MKRLIYLIPIIFWLTASCSGKQESDLITLQGDIFGTTYSINYPHQEEEVERSAEVQRQIDARLQMIDGLMSTWNQDSQLSQFNRLSAGASMKVNPELISILVLSVVMHRMSNGAFDITLGPIVNLWGFGPQPTERKLPTEEELAAAKLNIGMDNLQVSGDSLTKKVNLYIDLSAIAKGYAVDEVAKLLQQHGIENYLVEIGGEVFAQGRKPNGDKWRIAIEEPNEAGKFVHKVIELEGFGMATSGDYRNYYEEEGVRYSHTIDPRTMKPISHKLASATVIHQNTAIADALATAIMVMGPQRGLDFAERFNLAAYLISREGDKFVSHKSSSFLVLEDAAQ